MKPLHILIMLVFSVSNGIIPSCDAQSITDMDGNTYTTVKIGTQTWMGQNLNVSKFRNGDPIPEANTDEAWEKASMEKNQPGVIMKTSPNMGLPMENFTTGLLSMTKEDWHQRAGISLPKRNGIH